ncbi:hypothetical protein AWB71_03661 [Caballeronia peredens]|nr:hypothetical protein AWB71_03661 [Caballeronia peredens]
MSTAQARTPAEKSQAPVKTTSKASKKTQVKAATTPDIEVKAPAAESKNAAKSASKSTAKKAPAKAPAKAPSKAPAAETPVAAKDVAKSPAKPDAKARRVKKESAKKEKVVRDSFTMPRSDYAKIAALKQKCLNNGVRVKKSELLRAALALLDAAPDKRLVEAIKALETVKTGRPANA